VETEGDKSVGTEANVEGRNISGEGGLRTGGGTKPWGAGAPYSGAGGDLLNPKDKKVARTEGGLKGENSGTGLCWEGRNRREQEVSRRS